MSFNERTPLLNNNDEETEVQAEIIGFSKDDIENPRLWPRSVKLKNVAVIASMGLLSPLASSMFTPGIDQIAEDLNTSTRAVIATSTGFVIMLGFGPLFLAPLSETFGRRALYTISFSCFTLLQIPAALSPNIGLLIAVRTISGFFGSVGIANGGGTISVMFEAHERAGVFGWFLLGPLLGPSLGPLFGGFIVQRLGWRWIYWFLTVICSINTLSGWFFLRETYAPVLLARRKAALVSSTSASSGPTRSFTVPGEDLRPLTRKLLTSLTRLARIFIQPIVLTMSAYQALLFATTYSLFTNMQPIFGDNYGFSPEQVGLLYLAPGLGFLIAVRFLVPRIDSIANRLAARNGGESKPEFRLPLANLGAELLPVSLFWFAWAVQAGLHWGICIAATFFYGIGQVVIMNTVQNYYIDAFERYAASAIAAGAVLRSIMGGVVPLFAPKLFERLGYGWGISVFAFVGVVLAPAPAIFMRYGEIVRDRFRVEL